MSAFSQLKSRHSASQRDTTMRRAGLVEKTGYTPRGLRPCGSTKPILIFARERSRVHRARGAPGN